MKIAIPTTNNEGLKGTLAEHFGRAPYFTVYDKKSDEIDFISNTGEHFGGRQSAPIVLANNNIDVLICKSLGRRAVANLAEIKVQVYITAENSVDGALKAFKADELRIATEEEACPGRDR